MRASESERVPWASRTEEAMRAAKEASAAAVAVTSR
jgi:hypothetical protein